MGTSAKKKTATGFTSVQIDETLRETISHGTPDYPFQFYDENMDMFDFRCIDWHWHSELEFMLVEEGTVECYVGTGTITTDDAVYPAKLFRKHYAGRDCPASKRK